MFDVSFPEFVLCAIIGLLVLGPQRLPKVAAEIGKWVGRARRTATQLRRQLEREIELSELENEPPRRASQSAAPAQPTAAAEPPQAEHEASNAGAPQEPTIAPPAEPDESAESQERNGAKRELETTDASQG